MATDVAMPTSTGTPVLVWTLGLPESPCASCIIGTDRRQNDMHRNCQRASLRKTSSTRGLIQRWANLQPEEMVSKHRSRLEYL